MLNLKKFFIIFFLLFCALMVLNAASKNDHNSSKGGSRFLPKVPPIAQKIKAGVNSVKEKGSVLSSQFESGAKQKFAAGIKGLNTAKHKGSAFSSKFASGIKDQIASGTNDVKSLLTPLKRQIFYSNFQMPNPWREENLVIIKVNKDAEDIFEESLKAFGKFAGNGAQEEKKSVDEILKKKWLSIEIGNAEGDRITQKWFTMLTNAIINKHDYFEFPNVKSDVIEINSKNQQKRSDWYKFFGRITALAIINKKMLPVCFSAPFLKTMLKQEIVLNDLKDTRPKFFSIMSKTTKSRNIYFVYDQTELKSNDGKINKIITPDKKYEFIRSSIKEWYGSPVKQQMDAFMQGFNGLVPHTLIEHFSVNELSELICGTAITKHNVKSWMGNISFDKDIDHTRTSVDHLWDVMKEFDAVGLQKFLTFITGVPRVPSGGFKEIEMEIKTNSSACKLLSRSNTLQLPQGASKDQLASQLKKEMVNIGVSIPIHCV